LCGRKHLEAPLLELSYFKVTTDVGIFYTYNQADWKLRGFSDADHCSEQDRLSRLGYSVFMGMDLVIWNFKGLSTVVFCSTCESELYSGNETGKELLGVVKLKVELELGSPPVDYDEISRPYLFIDNEATVQIVQERGYHTVLKYIDIRAQWIIMEVELAVRNVSGVRNPADLHTK
jgi:hypothetical protein